ncbi:hypothetical protein N7508_001820 [Penicillium antarcticum]|uniref:uncharacterized protein n=1 Tax=Penicillium antarcticum TaxID=416450 RepID=UPI00238F94D5|nr:uncharacterized protein N7508_001820 [Penicillium antarcticum]KAJ5317312.1 hypothetical protein N7508_001820 [Penicillium antarcticum]
MKLSFAAILLGALPMVLAAKVLKSVIVTFPKGTPDSVVTRAKDSLVASGGVITHEYHLIKYGPCWFSRLLRSLQPLQLLSISLKSNHTSSGFAAEAPVNALQSLTTQDTRYQPDIEEDKIVTANGDYVGDVGAF